MITEHLVSQLSDEFTLDAKYRGMLQDMSSFIIKGDKLELEDLRKLSALSRSVIVPSLHASKDKRITNMRLSLLATRSTSFTSEDDFV